jgi:hypothetical protein
LLISFIYLFFLLGWDLFSSQQMPNSPDGDTFCPSAELDRLHKSVVRNIRGILFRRLAAQPHYRHTAAPVLKDLKEKEKSNYLFPYIITHTHTKKIEGKTRRGRVFLLHNNNNNNTRSKTHTHPTTKKWGTPFCRVDGWNLPDSFAFFWEEQNLFFFFRDFLVLVFLFFLFRIV